MLCDASTWRVLQVSDIKYNWNKYYVMQVPEGFYKFPSL